MVAEAASLAEIDQVFERECKGDWFGEIDFDILALVFNIGVLAQRDGAGADVPRAIELDAFFRALDRDY